MPMSLYKIKKAVCKQMPSALQSLVGQQACFPEGFVFWHAKLAP